MNNKIFSILAIFCLCGLLMSSVNAFTGPQTSVYYPFANEVTGPDHYRYSGDVVDIGHGRDYEKFYTGQFKYISSYYQFRGYYGYIGFCDGGADCLEGTYFNINLGFMKNVDHIDIWIWDRGWHRCPHINGTITFIDNTTRTFNGGNGNPVTIDN